ncbi:MAG TPA: DUF87 domain-containing protein, partial [Longimicrobium sp.]|nr:DUF87 domain-containing protein [Longimicrobium sp.]
MITRVERISNLTVGAVESVAADEISVLLEATAPRSIALNAGVPTGFPRLNGYVLIPNETGSLVGIVVRLWIERSPLTRTGPKDLIDLPFPLRKLTLTPVGTLAWRHDPDEDRGYTTAFHRGVTVFPSVGDSVLLPTSEQLRAIIESESHHRRVNIGTSPLLANSEITLDPDRLFGGHLAVLGNTGSGKSCTVAGLVRWSLEAAQRERLRNRRNNVPNARFIILDPNGEYRNSFADVPGRVRVYQIPPTDPGAEPLTIPGWMWNISEWSAFSSAAPSIQRPLLQQTLRLLRTGGAIDDSVDRIIRRRMRYLLTSLNEKIASGGGAYGDFGPAQGVGEFLQIIIDDGNRYVEKASAEVKRALFTLINQAQTLRDEHKFERRNGTAFQPFSETEMVSLRDNVSAVLDLFLAEGETPLTTDDAPIPFDVNVLPDYLEHVASAASTQAATQTAGLIVRIRNMLADTRLSGVIAPENSPSFSEWLERHIGGDGASNGQVTVVDLSLVPTDIIHLVVAVIGRIVFEAQQRYLRSTGSELPTVLILEEAHTFVARGREDESAGPTASDTCRTTFERIAREGRKFGLGLVISSQRPSELSPTVLSQCNTFLLHRLVNDRDQDLVGRLVPDTLGGMLRELPTLPARHAIIVGQATP